MKTISLLIISISLLLPPCQSADPATLSEDIRLNYVEATAAYELLSDVFPDVASTVTGIRIDTNALTLKLNSPKVAEVRKLIAKMDVRPKQIYLQTVITEIDPNGKEKVISRPIVYTLEGKPAEVLVSDHNGRKLKLTITATSVSPPAQ